jgi:tRNA(Ile)-lysidine synthase
MRASREHDTNLLLARYGSIHPAGFAALNSSFVSSATRLLVERLLSAVTRTVSGLVYPPRRERIARLREVLAASGPRGHTLGGCRFVQWRDRVLVVRELGHAAEPMRLTAGQIAIWDRRFQIVVPPNVTRSLTIGYPGAASVAQLRRLAPRRRQAWPPRLLLPVFPILWDEQGIAAVPHLGYRRERVGAVPQVIFRPVNALTQAGFAVV